ncbi:spore coat protein CotF [Paenibacillus phyllosphaerae]|uniref:Spore coat protein CotF n=2 Tax=Paenibacillus phyllosphaerae TaxID=274593 RepID=A0A7W5ATV1_9BACL|nr:spore coat protein CotF [Paenibacillus phyllosphaerae]
MANSVLRYFLATVEDREVKTVLKYACSLTEEHMGFKDHLFQRESLIPPQAFSDQDVNEAAPKLFSDTLMLHYLKQMGTAGMVAYALALTSASRVDIRDFFNHNLKTAAELSEKATTLMLEKGIWVKPPHLTPPQSTEWVHKESWINGLLGDRRPLNAVEITHLFLNVASNALGKAIMMGFAQVAVAQDVKDFAIRARDISSKHIEVFSSTIKDDDLPVPTTLEAEVFDSVASPFSDRLILFHTLSLAATGIGNYGTAAAASPRRDLAITYLRLMAEVGTFADDGAELMIKKGWLEKIPGALERDALIHS